MYASIEDFNQAPLEDAIEALRVCAPIDSWAAEIVSFRPFNSVEELVEEADMRACLWTDDEVLAAIASHAQLGKKPKGADANSAHSRKEQSSMGQLGSDTQERLIELQGKYLEQFGHIFLIRAAGRSADDILEALATRLARTPEKEIRTTADELRQIALLRLNQAFSSEN